MSAKTADAGAVDAGPARVPSRAPVPALAAGGETGFATLSPTLTTKTVAAVDAAAVVLLAAAVAGLVPVVVAAGVHVPSAIAESGAPFWHRCCCFPDSCHCCC